MFQRQAILSRHLVVRSFGYGIILAYLLVAAGCSAVMMPRDYVEIYATDGTNIPRFTRLPTPDDRFIQVRVGSKQLEAYGSNVELAAESETKRIVKEMSLCPFGYTLRVNPKIRSGDYGFFWTIACKSKDA